jgi:hypothetical protein
MDGTGSGSCPVAGFGANGVELSGSVTTYIVIGANLPYRMEFVPWYERVAPGLICSV